MSNTIVTQDIETGGIREESTGTDDDFLSAASHEAFAKLDAERLARADDARCAARWRIIMRAAADPESPEAMAFSAAVSRSGEAKGGAAEVLEFEAMVDGVIAHLAAQNLL